MNKYSSLSVSFKKSGFLSEYSKLKLVLGASVSQSGVTISKVSSSLILV